MAERLRQVELKNLYRGMDANFNRAKEGLRVCEDVCRFLRNEEKSTRQYKLVRHRLSAVMAQLPVADIVQARDVKRDVGQKTTRSESKRKDLSDVFYANSQRVKESIRVLEEFTKLIETKAAQDLKEIRYRVYSLEKEVLKKLR